MKFLKLLVLAISTYMMSPVVFAGSCTSSTPQTSTAASGAIVVQRDAAIGAVLYSGSTTVTGQYALGCTWPVQLKFTMLYQGGVLSSYGQHVYKTNVEGIGVVFNSGGTSTTFFDNPASVINFTGTGTELVWYGGVVQYIKTGPVKSGVLAAGDLAMLSLWGYDGKYYDLVDYKINSAVITSVACAITTPSLTFPMDTIPTSEFGSKIGYTSRETNTQNLGLNCDADANINVELSGTQNPDVTSTLVLALNGQGTTGVASGLGVQLLYNGAPLEINKPLALKKSAGGQDLLPIVARYYQTKTVVTAGDASTSATLTLTYQ